jgi:general secretion pathway protein C
MNSENPKPRLQSLTVIALLLLIGYSTADLFILHYRKEKYREETMRPGDSTSALPTYAPQAAFIGKEKFQPITGRNIFSRDQKISDPIGGAPSRQPQDAPVPTQLPISLVGTLVHANPARSVATLNLKSKNDVIAVRVDGEIPDGLGTVTKIERSKMIFRNNTSGRLEYVQMQEEGSPIGFNMVSSTAVAPGIIATSDNDRTVRREDLNRYLQDLPSILQQARAVPRIGANGLIECFNIAEMQAGSILEALGIRRGDCIESVNGEKIDSPAKAMETFQKLRNDPGTINLGFERGGRKESSNFTVTE